MSSANSADVSALADRLPLATIADALTTHGWWTGEDALPLAFTTRLRAELDRLEDADRLRHAGVGRETDYQVDRDIRRDRIRWLGRDSDVQTELLDYADALKTRLNRALFLSLFEFEGHFALYPENAFYRTHYDSFRGAANRVVSLVLFLNPGWQPEHGGELVLFANDRADGEATELAHIAPRDGTLVLFLSEEIPHEVRPTRVPRRSVAGWYRLNTSIGGQIDPSR